MTMNKRITYERKGVVDPEKCFESLQENQAYCFMMERSSEAISDSWIGIGRADYIEGGLDMQSYEQLKQYLAYDQEMGQEDLGPAVGYVTYEMSQVMEPSLPLSGQGQYPDMMFMRCEAYVHYEVAVDKVHILVQENDKHLEVLLREALLGRCQPKEACARPLDFVVRPVRSAKWFEKQVQQVKKLIHEGDVFQTVIAYPLTFELEASLFPVFKQLRCTNPSPYMYFIRYGELEIVGSSPETLVRTQGDRVMTMPIAGTIRRGDSLEEDCVLCERLKNDEKENAEHRMLVDLGRNDIGKISRIGSVRVSSYQAFQKLARVIHMTSQVEGRLEPSLNGVDAIGAVLPADTLSGAPKIRAMGIIQEIEQMPRGIYGGGIGLIHQGQDVDLCIGIRTFVKWGHHGSIQAGAGIVQDSDPRREYEEVMQKLSALLRVVEQVGGSYDSYC
ncbi:MAG: anthranilate synthase component I family protein [Cellulosilyticaceae bacterium]